LVVIPVVFSKTTSEAVADRRGSRKSHAFLTQSLKDRIINIFQPLQGSVPVRVVD
jgi:hypothetical protein